MNPLNPIVWTTGGTQSHVFIVSYWRAPNYQPLKFVPLVIAIILFMAVYSQAATPQQIAQARACAAIALIEVVNQHANLTDQPPRTNSGATSPPAVVLPETSQTNSVEPQSNGVGVVLKTVDAGDAVNKALDKVKSQTANPFPIEPMRIEYVEPVGAAPVSSAVDVMVITATWCAPCKLMMKHNGEGDSRVHFGYIDENDAEAFGLADVLRSTNRRPVSCWRDANGTTRYSLGYQSIDDLHGIIQRNNPPQVGYGARRGSSSSYQLHIRRQVQAMIPYWERWIGPDVPVHVVMSRGGGIEKISLLKVSQWDKSPRNLLGSMGSLRISMPQAKGPVKGMFFQWDFDANKVTSEILVDDLEHIGQQKRLFSSANPNTPYGLFFIDDILILANFGSILSGLETLASLFNPTLDLQLPPELDCAAILKGKQLEISFAKGPSVYFAELIRGTVILQKLSINENNVHAANQAPFYAWFLRTKDLPVVE